MSNGINGFLERWQWERKVEEGDVEEGSRCTVGVFVWNIHWDLGKWREMHGWVGVEVGLLLGIQGCEGAIHLFLRLQWMPLGNGATGVGQHVGPVFQPSPCGPASYPDLPDGIVLANLVVIQHCDHSLDFLGEEGQSIANKVQNAEKIIQHMNLGWKEPHSKNVVLKKMF